MNLRKKSIARMTHIYNLLLSCNGKVTQFKALSPNIYQLDIQVRSSDPADTRTYAYVLWSYVLTPQGVVRCIIQ